jgi:undecaprenyl-diphosphatase
VVGHRIGLLDPLFAGLSYAGSLGAVWLVLGAALSIARRRPEPLAWTLVAYAVADLLGSWLQALVGRARPPLRYPEPHALVRVPHSGSFPSIHAATSFACAGMLAWLAPRFAPWFFALAAAIAISRVYVGVHYPLDVLAGAALGLAVATALRWLAAARRRSPRGTRAG